MKYITQSLLMLSTALLATPEVSTFSEVFSEAKTSGNVKYYYIQTDKDNTYSNKADTSANANSVGGQLSFDTASLYGFSAGATFMTTNPFLLDGAVDTSIIGRDNGVRIEGDPSGGIAQTGFSVLGEGYLAYSYADFIATLGRKVIKTPLIDAKEVRMLPSAVEGVFAKYTMNKKSDIEVAYLDKFKQRTSSRFVDIINHALGSNTKAITGSADGAVVMAGAKYTEESFALKAYDYYADDFMNSFYVDGSYNHKFDDFKLTLSAQYINQMSVGHADSYMKDNAGTYGGAIKSNAFALKAVAKLDGAKFVLAYSNVLSKENAHDSLVLPWDGTPLYTNMITSNDLFQSNYGNALNADSIYIGGSQGIKAAYNQKFDSFGLNGFSTTLSYLNTSNKKFTNNQQDYNLVLGYKYDKQFSLALKGIWVQDNSGASEDGTVKQLKLLTQYRVIANYKF